MPITQDQARAAALIITGLGGTPTVTAGPAATDRTPFLARQIAELGPVWQVAWQGIRLRLPSAASNVTDEYSRSVLLRLSQRTGQLVSATLRAAGELPPDTRPTPEGQMAQQQLQQAAERYAGLPPTPPRQTLLQALDAVLTRGI